MKMKKFPLFIAGLFVIAGIAYTTYAPDKEKTDVVITQNNYSDDNIPVTDKTKHGELNFNISVDDPKYNTLQSKNIGWGIKKEKGQPPYIDSKTVKLFEDNSTYYIDKRGGKVLYLTFDEGYENGYTSKILDTLKEKNVPAAFFVTGPYLKKETELVDRMINEGHIVGNHTVNHPNLAKSPLSTVLSELEGLNAEYYSRYGSNMIYMRPPEGEYSEKLLSFASDIGYITVLWSLAYKDWEANVQKGEDYAYSQVVPYIHDGAVILLHAVSSDNANALGKIIDYARDNGYEFKSLDNLIS